MSSHRYATRPWWLQHHLSLLFALRYPHQDCLQCLGIKSLMRECRKSEYKNCRFLAEAPFNRRQARYAVAVGRQEECDDPRPGRVERSGRALIGASCLNVSWLLALVADALRRRFRGAVAAQMSLLATCCGQSDLEDASRSGCDIQL